MFQEPHCGAASCEAGSVEGYSVQEAKGGGLGGDSTSGIVITPYQRQGIALSYENIRIA